MDDLDAELFGNKKKISIQNQQMTPPKENEDFLSSTPKRAPFRSSEFKFDDFDEDDPLAGILSDDSQSQPESTRQRTEKMEKTINGENSDGLFGDDNDDLFAALGLDDEKPNTQNKENVKSSFASLLDTKNTSPLTQSRLSSSKPSKYHFDKDGNLITEKTTEAADLSFGSYLPSSVTAGQQPTRSRQSSFVKKDSFLDFLNSDVTSNTKVESNNDNISQRPPRTPSDLPPRRRSRNADFLELGDEVDLDALIGEKEPTAAGKPPSVPISRRKDETKKTEDFLISQPPASPTTSNFSRMSTPPTVTKPLPTPQPISRNTTSALLQETPTFFEESVQPSPVSVSKPSVPPANSNFPFEQKPPVVASQGFRTSMPENVGQVPILPNGISQNDTSATLRELQAGFQTDLEIAKQAYDSRIAALHSAVADIRIRAEREVEMMTESYNMRMEGVRTQIRDQLQEASEKDVLEQEEMKRLRSLHLTALEDTRLDYEDRIKRMKEAHKRDIESLKSSTTFIRDLDGMTRKVDEATNRVEQLAAKHDAACNNFEQKWTSMASDNKRILSGFQTQIEEIRNNSFEMQNNLQQTVSRLEGNMTEISRAMRETTYHLQLERNRLESSQTALENEKRQLLQQVSAQSAEAMRAHKEAIEMRQNYERDIREDNDRLRQREDQLQRSQRVLEEARVAESQLGSERDQERRKMEEELAKERAALAEKVERMAALEARLGVQKDELDRRQASVATAEKRLEKKLGDIAIREEELRVIEERSTRKLAESTAALEEAQRVDNAQASRLSEIHDNANALARQRLLLAEERKQIIEDRVKYRPKEGSPGNVSVIKTPGRFNSPIIPRKDLSFSPNNTNGSPMAALWMFTAQQDRDFLQDEQAFLEALKVSPRGQS